MFENLISTVEAAAMNLRDKVVYDVVYPAQIGLDSLMGKSYTPRAESDITDPDEIAKLYQSDVIERSDINNSKIGISKRYKKYWLSQLEKELAEDVKFVGEDEYTEPWENLFILSISDEEKEEILSRYKNKPIYAKMRKRLYYYDYLDDDGNEKDLLLPAAQETEVESTKSNATETESTSDKKDVVDSKDKTTKDQVIMSGSTKNNKTVAKTVENIVVKPEETVDKKDEAQVLQIGDIKINTAIEPVIFDTPPIATIPQPIIVEQPGFGNHRVDAPPKPKVRKTEPDKVETDLPAIEMEITTNPIIKPDFVQAPAAAPEVKEIGILPNERNKNVINQFPYLAEIERVANKNGIMLEMKANPNAADNNFSGIIICQAYNAENGQFNIFKTFGIDTGVIIDNRIKLIINRDMKPESYYEDMHFYSLFDKTKDENGKNQKKTLDMRLLDDFFKGGFDNISKREMFPQDIMELNKIVSLITVPSGTAMYNEIRKQLLEAMKNGEFDFMIPNVAGISNDGSVCMRFAVVDSNPHNKEFILSSAGVPYRHAFPFTSTKNANMYFSPGKKPRLEYII